MSTGKVVTAVLAGVATGALLGILFAPDKGSETRKKISKKTSGAVDDLKEKFNDLVNGIADKFESASDEGAELLKKGKDKAEEVKSAFS